MCPTWLVLNERFEYLTYFQKIDFNTFENYYFSRRNCVKWYVLKNRISSYFGILRNSIVSIGAAWL